MTATSREAIETHIKELLRNPESVGLIDWLAMTRWAHTHEAVWIEALTALDFKEASDFLELLNHDDAGPFANTLVMLTARHANAFQDDDFRAWLLEQAVAASDSRIKMIAEQRDELARQVNAIEKRQGREADLQTAIAALEKRRDELWAGEFGQAYDRVHKVEQEITRLETFERRLRAYDEEARQRTLSQLKADTDELSRSKDDLEQKLSAAIATRDQEQAIVDSREADHRAAQEKVAKLKTEALELDAAITALEQDELIQLKTTIMTRKNDKHELQSQYDMLREAQGELRGYDEVGRRAELDDMAKEHATLSQRRDDMNRQLQVAKDTREQAQQALDAATAELTHTQEQIESVLAAQKQVDRAEAECQRLWQQLVTIVESQLETPEFHPGNSGSRSPDSPHTDGPTPSVQSSGGSSPDGSGNVSTGVAGAQAISESIAQTRNLEQEVDALQSRVSGRSNPTIPDQSDRVAGVRSRVRLLWVTVTQAPFRGSGGTWPQEEK